MLVKYCAKEFEYPDVAQFPCPALEFDFGMMKKLPIHTSLEPLCGLGYAP